MTTARIIFVTGTDTGVGKTLLTVSLLHHLRSEGVNALAMKPFCSGGRQDVELIQTIQNFALTPGQVNPYFFSKPIAPFVSARRRRHHIRLTEVLGRIKQVAGLCECLIVEGSGGVLAPLDKGLFVSDLIAGMPCEVLVVGRNRLGTINHTMLTVFSLKSLGERMIKVVLMDERRMDLSAKTNVTVLRELLAPVSVVRLRYLGPKAAHFQAVKKNCRKIKKVLAQILD